MSTITVAWAARTPAQAGSTTPLGLPFQWIEELGDGLVAGLVRSRTLAVTSERDLGDDRALIVGTREVGGQTLGYMLMLKRMDKRVYTFEAWGPQTIFDEHAENLKKSAKSLRR